MSYAIKECFHTLQGEGAQAGRAAVFLRFAGCNLWSGREETRDAAETVCRFCDTDFVGTDGQGGGTFRTAEALADHVEQVWSVDEEADGRRYVVCTGGEPLLQLDQAALDALHDRGFAVAVETNGTIGPTSSPAIKLDPADLDWICVSPKADARLHLTSGDELKLVHGQLLAPPERFVDLDFDHLLLQPMDVGDAAANAERTKQAVDYCMRHPRWRLSLQTHKVLDIP